MLKRTFRGGVELAERKELTVDRAIRRIPAPPEITLPLQQHIGAPNAQVVNVGDRVKIGQLVAKAEAYISAPVHSPVSGAVKAIIPSLNPVFGKSTSLIIENDRKNESVPFVKRRDPQLLPKKELIDVIMLFNQLLKERS